jgi:hypothetical protein
MSSSALTFPDGRHRRVGEFTDVSRQWAHSTVGELAAAISAMSMQTEPLDAGARGAAIVARTDPRCAAVVFAGATENPSRVTLSSAHLLTTCDELDTM